MEVNGQKKEELGFEIRACQLSSRMRTHFSLDPANTYYVLVYIWPHCPVEIFFSLLAVPRSLSLEDQEQPTVCAHFPLAYLPYANTWVCTVPVCTSTYEHVYYNYY